MSMPTFSFSTTAEEVANALADEIQGKNVLITGTSMNGIGFEVARVLAKHANLVIITGYNAERYILDILNPLPEALLSILFRLKLSAEAIMKEIPLAKIRTLSLDLSSLALVRHAAAEVNGYPEPLHASPFPFSFLRNYLNEKMPQVLINNAAAMIGPLKLTVDKLESQMETDHIGPFLLTKLLAPKLLADGHAFGTGVDFSTIGRPDRTRYTPFDGYFQAKSANALTAIELSKRSNGRINAYSLHPGRILGPDGKPSTEKFVWKTIPQGAATTLVAAFDARINDQAGAYLVDCIPANTELVAHSSDPPSFCVQGNAEKLWTVTEDIIVYRGQLL
ncbi:hypothetical protein FB451DRAFT_1172632 [Mycena latifolia]|nr:hypothetical protein FB451DRAFT_1172632 [Mycena latifolia]